MLKGLIANLAVITSFQFLANHLFKHPRFSSLTPGKHHALLGFLMGVLGILLMWFSFKIPDTATIVDLRHLAVVLAAWLGGFNSAVIAGFVIAIGRITFIGDINPSSITGFIAALLLGLGCGLISQKIISMKKRWIYLNSYGAINTSMALFYIIGNRPFIIEVYLFFGLSSLVGGFVTIYLSNYLERVDNLFKRFLEESKTDFLTGLNNVRHFDSTLNTLIIKAQEHKEKLSLLYIDIDHFKRINDSYGHAAGDEVLKQMGSILLHSARSFDIVSRNGGEEFSILLPDCTLTHAMEIAERIRTSIENYDFILPDAKSLHLTASLGVSTYLETTMCPDELLNQADAALYEAKRTGRNKVCFAPICKESEHNPE